MPRRIPIRAKLACALAVPLAGLVGGAAFQVIQASHTLHDVNAETDLAAAAVGPGSLLSQLQNERNFTSVDVIGQSGAVRLPVASMDEARTKTDQALAELRVFVADHGADAEAAFSEGLAAVESALADVRSTVDTYNGPRTLENNEMGDQLFETYTTIIETLLDDTGGIALKIENADLRTGVEMVDLATRLTELRATTLRQAISYMLNGDTSQEARLDIASRLAEIDSLEASILDHAVAPYDGFADFALNDAFIVRQESLMRGFAVTGELDVTTLLSTIESGPDRGVLLVRRQASDRLLQVADVVRSDATEERRNAIVVSSSLVAAALALTILVSRSITRPLLSLTKQAEAMAGEHLPAAVQRVLDTPLGEDVAIPEIEPIAVRTRDEVRDVAGALNVVQRSALDLAVEQAVLRRNIADSFVNMGRRNQNLLDRQLDFITDLEREEQEPDRLASLFRLDHLATRMRRNAESLLRLAGSEPQRSAAAPIELGDVVRGALGEVEDYQRVHIRNLDQAAVPGGVGADLAHAVAELIENALAFSPPGEPVEVRGRRTAEGYVLAVADNGLGMTPDELAVANRRLAGEESFTVAPSRYLGHYVAGHLASRLGVRIELHPGPAGGLTARVDIPASLLVEGPAEPRSVVAPELEPTTAARSVLADPVPVGVVATADIEVVADAPPAPPAPPAPVAPAAPAADLFTPAPPSSPSPSTFGGLAPVAPTADEAPATTTPSGLVRRVPGAQHPTTDIGAKPNGTDPSAPRDRMSADAVSSFLSDFSAGIARGISDAGRNPWEESSDEPR